MGLTGIMVSVILGQYTSFAPRVNYPPAFREDDPGITIFDPVTLKTVMVDKNINQEKLSVEVDENLIGFFKLLEFKWTSDNKPCFGFSDYYRDRQSINLCEKLTKIGMLFKHLSSSKKHDYQTYYFRRVPLNFEKILEELVLSKINLEGLELATDWRIIALVMFSETSLKLEDIKLNFPILTINEINEILSGLENRGVISRDMGEIKIIKGMKEIIKNYFFLNTYQPLKNFLTGQLKGRVKKSLSNLYTIGLIKRIEYQIARKK